jgi:Bacterial membrane protein YfhO
MLIGLAALALYGATAAAALALARRCVGPLRWRPALALAAAPLLLTGRAFLTGGVYAPLDILYDTEPFAERRASLGVPPDRTPNLGDVVYQEIPWRHTVRTELRRGELPTWNPFVLAGEPLLAEQQPAVLHPATWIGLLLPLPQAWTYDMAVRLFLGMLCGYLFFLELSGSESAALVGGLAWGFSDFFVFFLGFPMAAAAAPFPLLLLGLRRLARRPGRNAVTLTVAALVLIIAAGHPETLLHAAAGAGAYFVFELLGGAAPRRGRSLGLALLAGAVTLGLMAVVLLPLAESLPRTTQHRFRTAWYAHQKRSEPPTAVGSRALPQIVPYALGVAGRGRTLPGTELPSSYAGSLVLALAAAGLAGRCRERWFFLGLGLASLAVGLKTPAADWLASLPLYDIAINEYLIFLAAFSACALAALGAARLSQAEGAPAFLVGSAGVLAAASAIVLARRPGLVALAMPPAYLRERVLSELVPLALGMVLVAVLWRRRRLAAAAGALAALLALQRTVEAGRVYPTLPAKAFYPQLDVLEPIPRGAPDRFAAIGMTLLPNVAELYGIEDVRGYDPMTLQPLAETFPLWCVPQGPWFNRVDDPTRPFLSFLNVRWMLVPDGVPDPPGWLVRARAERVRLLENPAALPRLFAPRQYRGAADGATRLALLGAISDFAAEGVIDADTGGSWVANGRADVKVERYGSRRFELRVEADGEALVGSSIPNWPGWRIERDGVGVDGVPFNHAFLGFRVPPGSHRVSLRYSPDGVRRGLAVSAATLAAVLVLLVRQRGSATTTD